MNAAPLQDAKILVVDDEPANLELLEGCLSLEGYGRVRCARSGEEALALFEPEGTDLVLLDLHMPPPDGFEVMHRLTERTPEGAYLPILVLTADMTPEARQRALSSGARDFVAKPLDVAEVLLRIRNLLETRMLHQRQRAARAAAEASAARAALLSEASRILASSLDERTTLATLVRVLVPAWADLCVVEMGDADAGLQPVALAHADPAVERALRSRPAAPSDHPLPGDDAWTTPADDPDHTIRVLLRSSGRTFGRLTLGTMAGGRQFATADMAFARELAARIAMAAENARLFRAAHDATQARDQVLRVVAHDLRNPLNSIRMANDYMAELGAGEEMMRSVRIIQRSTTQMDRLIEDLLEIARVENGTLKLRIRRVSPAELVEEAVGVLASLAAARSITLTVDLDPDLPDVPVDEVRVLQVLSNLVGNAIKFTPSGGAIRIEVRRDGSVARFAVSDTGPGISAEHIPHVFRGFWQAGPDDRRGIGLGLSVARGLVEAHGGRIWVESVEGEGSTFCFALPVDVAPASGTVGDTSAVRADPVQDAALSAPVGGVE